MLWMRSVQIPTKLVAGYADITVIVCAVAGSKPLILDHTIYGKMPNRCGYISLFTDVTGVYDMAMSNPNIYYYWERERPASGYILPPMPTLFVRGRLSADEPWHKWNEGVIADKIISICEDSITSKEPIDIVCYSHGLNHWGFRELFQTRYPEEYMRYEKYQEVPTHEELHKTLSKRFSTISSKYETV